MIPLATAMGVTRQFGPVVAVSDVNLQVGPGEVVGLVGANGAGKTTLIRVLLGLIHPTAGNVELFGEAPTRRTRRRVGYVPQGLGLYPDLSISQNRSFAAAAYGRRTGDAADDEFAAFGDRPVGALPLGVRRRLAFRIATGHDPDLLVLDEPTSGVDPLGRARLWEDIRSAAEQQTGVLVTTHYMSEAEQCDRLVVLVRGRLVTEGTLDEILGDATVVRVSADNWQAAFRALRKAGFRVGLVGSTVRVVQTSVHAVVTALTGVIDSRTTDIDYAPASFEEAFIILSAET